MQYQHLKAAVGIAENIDIRLRGIASVDHVCVVDVIVDDEANARLLLNLVSPYRDLPEVRRRLNRFAFVHGANYRQVLREHSPGSDRYVAHRDAFYASALALLLAEQSVQRPRLTWSLVSGHPSDRVLGTMIDIFAELRVA